MTAPVAGTRRNAGLDFSSLAPGTRPARSRRRRRMTGRAPGRRRWRLPLALIALVVLGGFVIALLAPTARPDTYLDPASSQPDGANALTDILGERGFRVLPAYSPSDALSAIRSAGPADVTLVITEPDALTARQRALLSRSRADLFLVGAGQRSLDALAPAVSVAGQGLHPGKPAEPRCGLAATRLAGSADLGGFTYVPPDLATGCYPIGTSADPSLVRYTTAGRTVTIVGAGDPFTNALLARDGNAALALNLLGSRRRIVWLVPEPAVAASPAPGGGPGSPGPGLIPPAAWLVVLQLCVAALLAAAWRARRFGPLIAERLPVVVRASETVEGHGRLYQARRARDRAGAALREATVARLRPALGLARDASESAITSALATRSTLSEPQIAALLFGPAPASDAGLVALALSLDELEKGVRAR